jgi:hypothetical protein
MSTGHRFEQVSRRVLRCRRCGRFVPRTDASLALWMPTCAAAKCATDLAGFTIGSMTLGEAVLEIAISQLGVHEQGGDNTGPEVDEFLREVGLPPGNSWCAAFVYWCFRQGAQQLKIVNPCPRTAGAVKLWTLADATWRTQVPAPGCIYVLDHGGGKGHAGIVEAIDGLQVATEISGNTNQAGSRQGNTVWRHSGPPEVTHGGRLLGYVDIDRAAAVPLVA